MERRRIVCLLTAERGRLAGVYHALESGSFAGQVATPEGWSTTDHESEDASETLGREEGWSLLMSVAADLHEVDEALARVERGTYGHCEVCGGPIGDDRLEAVPATRFCVEHESFVEQSQIATTVDFGIPDAFTRVGSELHDDDETDGLELGAEEAAMHQAKVGRRGGRRLTADEIERSEATAADQEAQDRARCRAEHEGAA